MITVGAVKEYLADKLDNLLLSGMTRWDACQSMTAELEADFDSIWNLGSYAAKQNVSAFANIPEELKALNQWVLWKETRRGNTTAKVPYSIDGHMARTNDSRTWGSLDKVLRAMEENPWEYNGIGFVFTAVDPYCGIDLDHCIHDGVIDNWALEIIQRLSSYAEISPSGTGVHVLAKGKKPTEKCKKGAIEIYEHGRYFTVTGETVGSKGLRDIQSEIKALCEERL